MVSTSSTRFRARPAALLAAGLTLASGALGCASPRTEVIVVVDTDMRTGPSAIDRVTIDVTSPAGDVQSSEAVLGPGLPGFPRTLGLVHTTGALGPFLVHVTGHARGVARLSRDASFSFVPGQTLVLRMDLLGSCVTTSCRTGETCGETGCRSIDIAPSELTPWTGTPPSLGIDGGSPEDAGAPPVDAGPSDAGPVDAPSPPVDAPVPPVDAPAPIDAPAPVDAGRDAPAPIDVGPPDAPPGTDAGPLRTCDALFGAVAGYNLCAERAGECEFVASLMGSSCDALCSGAGSTCNAAYADNGPDGCTRGRTDTCASTHNTELCVCARVP